MATQTPEALRRTATLRAAMASVEAGNPDAAVEQLAALVSVRPRDEQARQLLCLAGSRADTARSVDRAVNVLLGCGDIPSAASVRARQVQRFPGVAGSWLALAGLQQAHGDPAAAIRTLKQGLSHASEPVGLQCALALALARLDRTEEASRIAEAAVQASPDRFQPVWTALRCLPLTHTTMEEILTSREQHESRLRRFEHAVSRIGKVRAMRALRFAQDVFPLHYTCRVDDVVLQQRYGAALHQLVSRAHPELVAPIQRTAKAQRRLRVGFISSVLRRHTVSKLFGAWIVGLDSQRFDVHVWQVGRVDEVTRQLCSEATLHEITTADPGVLGQQIRQQGLDAVIFPELGMDARMLVLAAQRLAPFQAVAWGHPVTTGLPSVDVFLSSEAMEPPEDAASHYTEELVRFPGIGTCFARPAPAPRQRTRSDFGLPEDATLYLCTQSAFKLLPRQDRAFREILSRVPSAVLVLLRGDGVPRLTERLASAGVPLDRVVVLPKMPIQDFLDLNSLSDVVLDGWDWSGGVTTLESIACGRAPITMEGALMRTRHTAAILREIDLPEMVAETEQDYIELAVRLGLSPDLRDGMRAKVVQTAEVLYGDDRSTRALASLLEERCANP